MGDSDADSLKNSSGKDYSKKLGESAVVFRFNSNRGEKVSLVAAF